MSAQIRTVINKLYNDLINERRFELWDEIFHPDCISHTHPYVGVGIMHDESQGDKVLIKAVAAESPAEGKLQPEDEIIKVQDGEQIWHGFDEVRTGVWGLGIPGTSLTISVKRDEEILDIPITRGMVKSFDNLLSTFQEPMKYYYEQECPDYKIEINQIIIEGEMAAVYFTCSGTNITYQRFAFYPGVELYRFDKGKIIENWSIYDNLSEMKQVGYQVLPPVVLEKAR